MPLIVGQVLENSPSIVPTGLGSQLTESALPTLKRGANLLCAYGAVTYAAPDER